MKLKPSPWRVLLLLVITSCVVALGISLTSEKNSTMGWLLVGFFGLGAVSAFIRLLPGSNYLDIRPDGMHICNNYRNWCVRWTDVQEFFPGFASQRSVVCWNYVSSNSEERLARKFTARITGFETCLPDTYGMRTKDLCDLLNDWRKKHAVAA